MNENYHIDLLNSELQKRMKKNAHYSLRSFARDLNISPSLLSEVLSQKKGMSAKKAEQIALALQLSRPETKYFILSVQAKHSRSTNDRESAKQHIQTHKIDASMAKKMAGDEFSLISDWHYNAILELTEVQNFDHTIEAIAQRLNISLVQAAESVEKMLAAGFLERKDGKLVAAFAEYETSNDIPLDAIKKHHQQMLTKAGKALFDQSVLQREFLNMTLSFDANRLEEAQKEIRKFQRAFADKFYSQQDTKNSVYQFALQFFRLDRQGDSIE